MARFAPIHRWLAAAAVLIIAFTVACDDDTHGDVVVEPTPRVPGIRAPQGDTRIEEVIIYADRLEPRQLNLTSAVPAEIQIANRSESDCTFFIGDYLTGLRVPAGETAKMSLTVPADPPTATVVMGCQGDEQRRGSAVIQFKGVLPGAGR